MTMQGFSKSDFDELDDEDRELLVSFCSQYQEKISESPNKKSF